MKISTCIIRVAINFFSYLSLSFFAIYGSLLIANFLSGQTHTISYWVGGEHFLVWIVMAIFIRQISGDISVIFIKKSKKK